MCDTVAIVESGHVLFAKNSDRDPNEAQVLEWHPRREYEPNATVRCTWITIRQAARTHAILISRPFWMCGAEIGTNEHGVTIGNEAVFTKASYAATGLTGMDLLRLALERAATAEEACKVIADLLERHGQGGGCGHENRRFTYHNSYIAADPERAFVLETAGRNHAVEEIQGGRTISNGLTIPGFADRYTDRLRTRVSACHKRQARTTALAQASEDVSDLFALLRDYGPGRPAPRYRLLNGAMEAPCMHAGGLLANGQTTASWVASLSAGDCRHWVTATSTPTTSLFKPVAVDTPLDLGPPARDQGNDSFWWRHERFARQAMQDPERAFPVFLEERDTLEHEWLAEPPLPAEAFRRHDERLRAWSSRLESATLVDTRPFWVRRYWRERDRWAGLC